MEANEQLFDKIEDYLKGKLPAEEASSFEKEIAANPSLAEIVDMHRFEREGMEFLVEENLREKIKKWETHPPGDDNGRKGRSFYWGWGTGLAAIALIAFFTFFFYKSAPSGEGAPPDRETPAREQPPEQDITPAESQTPSGDIPIANEDKQEKEPPVPDKPQETKNEYLALAESFHTLPDNLSTRLKSSETESLDNTLAPGLKAFREGQYDLAIQEFSKISPEQNPAEYELAREYLAHAYFEEGQYAKAAEIFEAIAGKSSTTTLDRAEWYLVLSLLPEYRQNKAKVDALLAKMLDPGSYHNYNERAGRLKARIDRLQE